VNFVKAGLSNTVPQDLGPGAVNDLNGHGSHVASSAAARGVVIAGVAPAANVISARVLNRAGSGRITDIAEGMIWCVDQGAHVINVSIGGIVFKPQAGFTTVRNLYQAIADYAAASGSVLVISAGNSNLELPNPGGLQATVPAEVENAITVGATGPVSQVPAFAVPFWDPFDSDQVWQGPDGRAFYSNYGTGVTMFAPGGRGLIPTSFPRFAANGFFQGLVRDNIYGACASTTPQTGVGNVGGVPSGSGTCNGATNRYVAYAGTSMAAPHVAGAAAVLYAEIGGAPSAASRDRVVGCLRTTADDIGPANVFGGGRVNVKKAVDALKAGTC
jgi:subtilisin family serine protease